MHEHCKKCGEVLVLEDFIFGCCRNCGHELTETRVKQSRKLSLIMEAMINVTCAMLNSYQVLSEVSIRCIVCSVSFMEHYIDFTYNESQGYVNSTSCITSGTMGEKKQTQLLAMYLNDDRRYEKLCNRDGDPDNHQKALFYIIGQNDDLYSRVNELYDFKRRVIKVGCLKKVTDLSKGSVALFKLGLHLFTDSDPMISVREIFGSLDGINCEIALEAIRIRYPFWKKYSEVS